VSSTKSSDFPEALFTMTAPPSNAPSPEELAGQYAEFFAAGGTPGQAWGLDPSDYDTLYAVGHAMHAQRRYADAAAVFRYVNYLNPFDKRFPMALGSCLQMTGEYEQALASFTMASMMDMTDPQPSFHQSECMIALGMVEEARRMLVLVAQQCKQPAQSVLKSRATALIELLNNQSGAHSPEPEA